LCITPLDELKEKLKEENVMHVFVSRLKNPLNYFFLDSLYDVQHFKESLREQLGDWTFQVRSCL
jgi:hypothetical protein